MKINEFLKKGKYKGKEMEWKINTGKCFPCFVEIWNHIKSFLYFSYKHFLCVSRHLKSLLFRDKRETYRDGEQLHEFITIKFFTREMCTYWHSIQGSNFSNPVSADLLVTFRNAFWPTNILLMFLFSTAICQANSPQQKHRAFN